MKQREEINSAVSSHCGLHHVCYGSITWPVLPDRVNFMIKKKRKYNKMGGSCFLITNDFSAQLKTSTFFSVSLVLINKKTEL